MKNFEFKKLSHDDIPLLHSWMKRPHLQEFWPEKTLHDYESFKEKYEGAIDSKEVAPYLVMLQGKPIGYIQAYPVDNKTYGIDQFIAVPEFINKGLGSMFVKEFSDELLINKKATRIITDPSVLNLRAQKAYEKAGFKKLEVVQGADGEVLMMEKKLKERRERSQSKKIKKAS